MRSLARRFPRLALILLALIPLLGFYKQDPFGLFKPETSELGRRLAPVLRGQKFDLVGWEVRTLSQAILGGSHIASATNDRATVERFFMVGQEIAKLRAERTKAAVLAGNDQDLSQLQQIEAKLAALEQEQKTLAPEAQAIIASQIDSVLRDEGLRNGFLQASLEPTWPPFELRIVPPVYFQFQKLPLLLVVAPRDRITVLRTEFLRSDLDLEQIEQIETNVDRLEVSSLVTPIGGFAAFPSMIPDTMSLRDTLITVAHEWTHHYLTMRPLGWRYFKGYEFRMINETVASMVGDELGNRVYDKFYRDEAPVEVQSADAPKPAIDFNREMIRIRQTTEAMLANGQIAESERYLADQRQWLADHGYYIRKLNNAYLTFYGSYAGSGNAVEPKLRALRAESESLAVFLTRVSNIWTLNDFERLVAA